MDALIKTLILFVTSHDKCQPYFLRPKAANLRNENVAEKFVWPTLNLLAIKL